MIAGSPTPIRRRSPVTSVIEIGLKHSAAADDVIVRVAAAMMGSRFVLSELHGDGDRVHPYSGTDPRRPGRTWRAVFAAERTTPLDPTNDPLVLLDAITRRFPDSDRVALVGRVADQPSLQVVQ